MPEVVVDGFLRESSTAVLIEGKGQGVRIGYLLWSTAR